LDRGFIFIDYGSDLSMVFFVNASTILHFSPILNVSIAISSPLPYEFVGKVGPAFVNLSLFLYILEGRTSTSTMIIFIRLKLEQNRYLHALWSRFIWEARNECFLAAVREGLAVAPSHVSFTHTKVTCSFF